MQFEPSYTPSCSTTSLCHGERPLRTEVVLGERVISLRWVLSGVRTMWDFLSQLYQVQLGKLWETVQARQALNRLYSIDPSLPTGATIFPAFFWAKKRSLAESHISDILMVMVMVVAPTARLPYREEFGQRHPLNFSDKFESCRSTWSSGLLSKLNDMKITDPDADGAKIYPRLDIMKFDVVKSVWWPTYTRETNGLLYLFSPADSQIPISVRRESTMSLSA